MADSTGFQKRIARLNNNASEYVVETYMEDLGDLPDIGVFLMEILDTNDPARDSLARVCTVADYTAFGTDRITAVASNQRFYRASATTKIYTSVEVAVAAAGLIEGNVDVLVKDFQSYLTDFDTSGIVGPPAGYEPLTWPLVVDSYKEELIQNYTDARDAYDAQVLVVANKEVECAGKQATTASYLTEVQALTSIQDALAGLNSALTDPINGTRAKMKAALDAGTTFRGQVQAGTTAYQDDVTNGDIIDAADAPLSFPVFNAATGTMDGHITTFTNALSDGYGSVGELGVLVTVLDTKKTEIDGLLITANNNLSVAQNEEDTCAQQLVTEETKRDEYENAMDTALQNVKDVCPDFDETTV